MPSTTTAAAPQARDLAARWNLHRAGREWRGSCPACGYGADAFCLTESKGRALAWCASCQDRIALAALLRDEGAGRARAADPAAPDRTRAVRAAKQRERAIALWNGASPIEGTPAETYLAARGVLDAWRWFRSDDDSFLRYRPDCPHPTERARLPAMLAAVMDMTGKVQAIHRTFIKRDGSGKADVIPQKATLGPIWGGVIPLHPLTGDEPIVIGEGIETALSAALVMRLPCWAAVNAGNLAAGLALPPAVRSIVIAADNDAPGERAALAAARRWQGEGRTVRIARPDVPGQDFNDVLRARRDGGLA